MELVSNARLESLLILCEAAVSYSTGFPGVNTQVALLAGIRMR